MRTVALTLRREDGLIVSESVQVADTIRRRMWGLLGRKSLPSGEGILLRPAWSIHTAFMRFPIDVVFIDPEQIVIRIEAGLRPFKTASCRGAREIVELTAGECERRGLEVGDRIAWASRSLHVSAEEPNGDDSPRRKKANVVVASNDRRFTKLAAFMLEGRGLEVTGDIPPDDLNDAIADEAVDGVILDIGDRVGDALRFSNATRALRPDLSIVVVGDRTPGDAPEWFDIYDKWEQLDGAIDSLEGSIASPGGGDR